MIIQLLKEDDPLLEETKQIGVEDFIKTVYKDPKLDEISYGENEKGFWVSLGKSNSVKYYVTDEGVQGKNVPPTILNALGEKIESYLVEKDKVISKANLQITELQGKVAKLEYVNKSQNYELEHVKNQKGRLQKQVKIGEDRLDEYNKENRKLKE